jgi:Ca-activated chloride channel family protein
MPAGDRFAEFEEGGTKFTASEPVSTFSIDVDTTSYAYVRRLLEMGQTPPADAIRVEEMINYFSYDYAAPHAGGDPFAPTIAVHPSPWNENSRLVHIGIKAESVDISAVPPANLVLLIDTSGSMDEPDRLPLLKRAFALLVNEMGPDDTVSIVTYAGSAGVVLEPTKGSEKAKILAALENLQPGGSTAGAQGIEAAYRLAAEAMIEGGTNRVLLATDGDFNVGISDPQGLERLIEAQRRKGIFLSVLGFGMGNYNDVTMQSLAQAGNGNAAYIDSYSEARKVLVEELGGTLMTVAKDVKVQVEFNPLTVSEYRLIGYETRALNREDFNNDAVDAGDVGAGHSVTAIYEIVPVGARGSVDPLRYGDEEPAVAAGDDAEYGFLKIRYKAPDSEVSELIEAPIPVSGQYGEMADVPEDLRFATAVAAFGQKLRGSGHLAAMGWEDIRALAASGRGGDETGRRAEFVRLVDIAASLN